MTAEEIKEKYSMRDILPLYGIHLNRGGYACCPFHNGDREPSLKVYQKDYYCFACGASGDIFTFVQEMDHLTFREAFQQLGGDYGKVGMGSRMKMYHAQKERKMQEKHREASWKRIMDNLDAISSLREKIPQLEPFSDEWCQCQLEMTKQIAIYDYLQENGGGSGIWSR